MTWLVQYRLQCDLPGCGHQSPLLSGNVDLPPPWVKALVPAPSGSDKTFTLLHFCHQLHHDVYFERQTKAQAAQSQASNQAVTA